MWSKAGDVSRNLVLADIPHSEGTIHVRLVKLYQCLPSTYVYCTDTVQYWHEFEMLIFGMWEEAEPLRENTHNSGGPILTTANI